MSTDPKAALEDAGPEPADDSRDLPERRVAKRFPVHVAVSYRSASIQGKAQISSMSRSGARLEQTSEAVPLGTNVAMELCFFPGAAPILLSAEVVRETPGGFAVKFVSLTERNQALLRVVLPKAAKLAKKGG